MEQLWDEEFGDAPEPERRLRRAARQYLDVLGYYLAPRTVKGAEDAVAAESMAKFELDEAEAEWVAWKQWDLPKSVQSIGYREISHTVGVITSGGLTTPRTRAEAAEYIRRIFESTSFEEFEALGESYTANRKWLE